MGWPSTLSYSQVAATGIRRSLSVLAHYGDLETAKALLTANPSLAEDPEALGAAAEQGHESLVHLLLEYCPQLAARVAVVARTRELTELLFQNGMNPNLARFLGVTPLHRFAQQGNVEHAAVFLDNGADLHARDEEFRTTPLGYAAHSGKRRMVEFLLRRGARPTLPAEPVWATPLALATFKGHDDVVRLLKLFESKGLPSYDLKSMESLAHDLVVACDSGETGAFTRVVDHFYIGRPMAWDRPGETIRASRLRRFVRERLGLPQSEATKDALALSAARLLIARSYGFESWRELEARAE